MPLTLGLPGWILRRVTLAHHRRLGPKALPAQSDPADYFNHQYTSTPEYARRFMPGIDLVGARVLDVGCGLGGRMPYWIDAGAATADGVDINHEELRLGREILDREHPAYSSRIAFLDPGQLSQRPTADVAILVDSFEHLVNPRAVLSQCAAALRPGGLLWIGSIGWYNYLASHCLGHIPIPWCQVLFSEADIISTIQALLRHPDYQPNYWERSEGIDRWDGITTLRNRPGEPLNQLSLRAIRRELQHPGFRLVRFKLHPLGARSGIGGLVAPLLWVPGLDELLHGYYTATLERLP
ncbi:MAG: class I SAM-dependent methyltransferase [Gemmatimonadales bacterium]